jgi:NAD-dependent dihydropyrimidine dehydrogenase PreA subunit
MGLFIRVEIDHEKLTSDMGNELVELCPVDIFALEGEQLVVVPANEDECTLCELCLKHAPAAAITIHKLYKNETLVS